MANSKSRLLVGQSGLHGLLSIHALSLQLCCLILYIGLLLAGQVGQGGLQASLCAQLLCCLLSAQVLLAHSEASLLVCQRCLHGLLSIHALRLHLSRLVLHVCLLRRVEVGQCHLQIGPKSQLCNRLLSAQVLSTHSKTGLLVRLLSREPRLLFRVELLLARGKAFLKAPALDICLELSQVTSGLRLYETLASAAERACANCGGVAALARDVILALGLTQRDVSHRLLVGRHVLLQRARGRYGLGCHALCWAHLCGAQALRAKTGLRSGHGGSFHRLGLDPLCWAHLEGLQAGVKTSASCLH